MSMFWIGVLCGVGGSGALAVAVVCVLAASLHRSR